MKGGLSSKLLPVAPLQRRQPVWFFETRSAATSADSVTGLRRNLLAPWVGHCGNDLRLDRLEAGFMTPESYGLLASVHDHFLFWFTFRGRIQL